MNKRELQIIVAGEACNGKSTMMFELHQILVSLGYNVTISLEEDHEYKDEKDFCNKMMKNRNERIDILRNETKITLKSIQLQRGIKNSKKAEGETNHND